MGCGCDICKNSISFEMPEEIIESAKNGDIVLFCGAGISTENKSVLPYTLYDSVKKELNISEDTSVGFSCLMQKYCSQPNGRKKLLQLIKKRFDYIHSFPELERMATRFHKELSELYFIKTIITTNWDTYFEQYCGAQPLVTKDDLLFLSQTERTVIKIHGSYTNPGAIIATQEDYEKCKEQLKTGYIGSKLKTILAEKTVVFIGYSFGDDDFKYIFQLIRNEMKDISPYIYIVTLDKNLSSKLCYDNCSYIVTDGVNFLHQLKLHLQKEKLIVNCDISKSIKILYDMFSEVHQSTSKISCIKYPKIIFSLVYQDGVLHALERYIKMHITGEYNKPCANSKLIHTYEQLIEEKFSKNNFADAAYYKGYQEGLILIELIGEKEISIDEALDSFPLFYLPGWKKDIMTIAQITKILEKKGIRKSKFDKYAEKLAAKVKNDGIVIHHLPL